MSNDKPLPTRAPNSRGARSIQRILDAAARLFGREGFRGASMHSVAAAAGVSKGLLHYHFRSKEHLLIEAQRATFRQVHRRFSERFHRGERGLGTAVEGLDALWEAILEMRAWAPFMVETMSLVNQDDALRSDVEAFYAETEALLREGIEEVFSGELHRLSLPPDRLALLVKTSLHGLIVELAYATDDADVAIVHQAYVDLRDLFERVAFTSDPPGEIA